MRYFIALLIICSTGCATTKTVAEERSGYAYIPVDPIPANETSVPCAAPNRLLGVIESLPDSAVRTLVQQVDGKGNFSFGIGEVKEKGSAFQVTVDFINSTTVLTQFYIKKTAELYGNKEHKRDPINPWRETKGIYTIGSELYEVYRADSKVRPSDLSGFYLINIPVYVGLGIRVKSTGSTLDSNVDISGLAKIGLQAEAKAISGSLVAQTLGISGKAVTSALPLHSDLNLTTTTDAVGAAGSIKAQLFSEDAVVSPRVVGFYLPLPADVALVNAVVSALSDGSAAPLVWSRSCVPQAQRGPVLLN
ncbi:hypothetical protein [Stigmatella erecta]|uniref:Uncharacterized protein n=1 Tax=Stigmatella erecta TaxID=83460 RepID=A0A1I0L3E6_9BACT|nr:hypothetical protein [Stigmatella erecta]SEU33961.1 hypothetical protein SAMN05443639_1182 [Stigmatella erecta]